MAVALTFSSTIIIVKLLSDKRELDSLHGRIAVGFLIVQDIAVVIAMMIMSGLGGLGGAALLLYALMRYLLPRVVDTLARAQELLYLDIRHRLGNDAGDARRIRWLQQRGRSVHRWLFARFYRLPRSDQCAIDQYS